MKIKNILYNIVSKFFLFFLIISLKFNLTTLFTFILYLTLHKSKKILNPKRYKKVKIIINKSAGISDIEFALSNKRIKNKYLILERKYLILIQEFFLKQKFYDFDFFNNKITKSQKFLEYENFLDNVLKKLQFFLGDYSFFSFNFAYFDEFSLHKLCFKNNINFSVINKESISSPGQISAKKQILKKLIKSPLKYITKIFVYNKFSAKLLIETKVFEKEKIIIGGCARAIKITNFKNTNNDILYFFTDDYAGKINHLERLIYKFKILKLFKKLKNSKKLSFKKINLDVIKSFITLSNKFNNLNFIIKVKSGNTVKEAKLIENKIKNKKIKFFYGGAGHDFIPSAKVVVGLNTTAVFESLNAEKPTIIPFEKNFLNKNNREFFYEFPKKNLVIGKKNIIKTIEDIILSKNKKRVIKDKRIIQYYLGDVDRASKLLFNFLEKY